MTLLDRSRALAADVTDLNARRNMADQVKAVRARREAFEEVRGLLTVASAKRAALGRHGVDVAMDLGAVQPLIRSLKDWKASIAADPSEIVTPSQTVQSTLIGPIKSLARRIEDRSAQAWSAHVQESLPQVSDETLKLRERLPAMKRKVDHLRETLARAKELAAAPPTSEAGFVQFQTRATACRDAWAELEGEALPDEVRRFLKAASQPAGASIDLLFAGETLDWLQRQGLVDHFRIRGS